MSNNKETITFPKTNVIDGFYTIDLKWLEEIGFEFTDIPGNDEYLLATLPEGWRLEQDDKNCSKLFDNNGFLRAKNSTVNMATHTPEKVDNSIILKITSIKKLPAMNWRTRYNISTQTLDFQSGAVVFGNSDETIYAYPFSSMRQWGLAMLHTDNWVRENYPHHGNPFYYWDINLEKAPQRILGTQKTDK